MNNTPADKKEKKKSSKGCLVWIIILLHIIAVAVGIALNLSREDTPEDIVEKYVEALEYGEYEDVKEYGFTEDMFEDDQEIVCDGAIIEIVEEDINGDRATVKCNVITEDGTEEHELSFKKVDGDWKYDFNYRWF